MAYIGRSPVLGSYKKIDDLTSQFNSAQTVFTLLSGGAAADPGTSQNLLVSLGGVIQEPGVAYTVAGPTITFTSAPANTQPFFAIMLGDALDVGYLTEGVSINVTNISAGGTLALTGNATLSNTLSVTGNATFSNNVTVLGTLQVGNSTITLNTTTLLVGNASSNVVINSSSVGISGTVVTSAGLAATNPANTSANGVVTTGTQSLAGDKTFVNNVTVTGNLTVLGTAVTLNSENVLIKDNILTLSSNVTGTPVLDAGIEVNRGTSANVTLKWNETSDRWQLTNDGSTYENIVLPSTAANSSANGVVSTTTQTFAGEKTFQNAASFSNTVSITGAANTLSTLGVTGTLSALGQLSVTGNATFDTSTLFVDATNDRVGIGNTTPSYKLHIGNHTATAAPHMLLDGVFADTTAASHPRIYFNDKNFGIGAGGWATTGNDDDLYLWAYNGTGRDIRFCSTTDGSTAVTSGSWTTNVIIKNDGKVGIGNTAPAARFTVGSSAVDGILLEKDDVSNNSGRLFFKCANGSMVLMGIDDTIPRLTFRSAATLGSTSGTERVNFSPYGISLTTSINSDGNGIKFPATQSASTDANTLDDYEEGTWTPELRDGSTVLTQAYSYRIGIYHKIGRMVHIHFAFLLSSLSGTSTNALRVYGLPFSSAVTGPYQEPHGYAIMGNQPTATDSYSTYLFVASGGANLEGRLLTGGDSVFTSNRIDGDTFMKFSMIYWV